MSRQAVKPRLLASLPPSVHPGDRVGVAALSGPVDPAKLERGLQALRELGYEPVEAVNLRARAGLFAGSDEARLDAFHTLVADPSVKAIVFARGGHGLLRLMPAIDWRLLARRPKAYVGYSDLTPFLLRVVSRLGLVAFHGPMIASDLARGLDEAERDSLRDALAGRVPMRFALSGPVAVESTVSGPLLGGCLSMLVATLGTRYAPRLDGALLFLEDVGEPLYRLDRMLTHLELSGRLSKIRGLIVGHLAGCGEADIGEDSQAGSPAGSHLPAVERASDSCGSVLREAARRWGCPLVEGLAAGHSVPNMTLPLGLTARLEPGGRHLVVG